MPIDLTGLSVKELRSLISTAEKQQTKILTRPKAAAMRAKINKYAKDHGYTIQELYEVPDAAAPSKSKKTTVRKSPSASKLGKVAPKYRNPATPNETWTGRGRQPKWMAALVQAGKSPADFLI
ncbi:H-NS family nucleoid-associated regulatory protein [Stenotrophomonas maltophilia]|uniref:H-NS histone family protein n=1 Tax=Stenotrophomonas maltophilia TaxID=40324 RepID=UPI001F37FEF7|nr:H-NS histone family protein [Stenotrophomonas maltophilia]MCF3525246.1 H-NS histone family protein [Stenotrophomonas maltophilia]MCF3554416.1 H-NS histone family protein [Stenotrophomonas maltophilia]